VRVAGALPEEILEQQGKTIDENPEESDDHPGTALLAGKYRELQNVIDAASSWRAGLS